MLTALPHNQFPYNSLSQKHAVCILGCGRSFEDG
jgi:hypothetical protein